MTTGSRTSIIADTDQQTKLLSEILMDKKLFPILKIESVIGVNDTFVV